MIQMLKQPLKPPLINPLDVFGSPMIYDDTYLTQEMAVLLAESTPEAPINENDIRYANNEDLGENEVYLRKYIEMLYYTSTLPQEGVPFDAVLRYDSEKNMPIITMYGKTWRFVEVGSNVPKIAGAQSAMAFSSMSSNVESDDVIIYFRRDGDRLVAVDFVVTITWDADGGTCSLKTSERKVGDKFGWLPTPTRPGYDFGGWYTGKNGTGKGITKDSKVTICDSTTYYAKWNPWPRGPADRILAYETKYRDVDPNKIKQFLAEKNSIWTEYDYIDLVIKAAKEKDCNPLLLIAIAGHEQSWASRDIKIYRETASWDPGGGGRDKVQIMAEALRNGNLILPFNLKPDQVKESDLIWMMATNPFNVFNAWWNSVGAIGVCRTVYESSLVACNTITKFASKAPEYNTSNNEFGGKRWERSFLDWVAHGDTANYYQGYPTAYVGEDTSNWGEWEKDVTRKFRELENYECYK